MQVFSHHLYEYKKGLRSLILHTAKAELKPMFEKKLERNEIAYFIQDIDSTMFNIFFGDENCVNVVRQFGVSLDKLTDEQDFILGVMLGYDRILQCKRYLSRKNAVKKCGKMAV
jgi:hypothetical protein